jgi:hypothetical protein
MPKPVPARSEEQASEANALRNPRPVLTKEQQEATIQKWADWILKQRKNAAEGKLPE